MADKRLDQTTNASAVAAADNIPFVTAAGVTSYVTGDELAASGPFSSRYAPLADDQMFIPANAFSIAAGASASTTGGINAPCYLLDGSSVEYVATATACPAGWNTVHVDCYWTNAGAGAGDVQFRLIHDLAGDGDALNENFLGNVVATAPIADTVEVTRMTSSALSVASNKLLCLQFRRNGNAGADTLGNDAALLGLMLVRAS